MDMKSVLSAVDVSMEEEQKSARNRQEANSHQVLFSPRMSEEAASNFARASSNMNSSMMRNSVPQLNSAVVEVGNSGASAMNFTFGPNQKQASPQLSPTSNRPTSSPVHAQFSPVTTP